MNTEDSNSINDTDDLAAFEAEFFKPSGTKSPAPKPETEVPDAEDTSTEEDALATDAVTETEAESDDNEDADEIVEKPKKHTAKGRIQELNTKYRESERRVAELERKLQERDAPTKVEAKEVPTPTSSEPTPDDKTDDGTDKYPLGEYDPQYIKDLIKFTTEQERTEAANRAAKENAEREQQTVKERLNTDWTGKLNEAEKTDQFSDIREVGAELVNEFADLDPQYGEYLASTIMTLDKGVEVFHYLATHLDEARKLVASGPTAATIALGRIEARFTDPENGTKTRKVTTAPEPPKSLNRGTNGKFEVADDTDDLDAFAEKFFAKKRR